MRRGAADRFASLLRRGLRALRCHLRDADHLDRPPGIPLADALRMAPGGPCVGYLRGDSL